MNGIGISPTMIGGIYAFAGIAVLAALWYKGLMCRKCGIPLLVVTFLFGFLFFAPMPPWQVQLLILDIVSGAPLVIAMFVVLALILVLVFLFGRILCGHFCPVGAIQELGSQILPWKWHVPDRRIPQAVRVVVFLGIVIAAFFSVSVLQAIGVGAFFHLTWWSPLFGIFAVLVLLSLVVYRPFCRFVCPFGVFLALTASKSRFAFVRTDACIECGKCERACPTDEARRDASKAECYMCGRCIEVCPVEGALVYKKRGK
jgi:ferredoxin-type protein NapH